MLPDRPLPHNGSTHVPDTDAAHTQLGTRYSKKNKYKYPQAREFDKYGNPVRDIDFTDHGRPLEHRSPHQHRWEFNSTGGSQTRVDSEDVTHWVYPN